MNKHIVGLIIFSFIVGISAIIASFFVQMPQIPTLDQVRVSGENPYIYRGHKSCGKKKRKPRPRDYSELASAKVSQAVFDLDKKQLDTEFTIERTNDSTETVNVALHFFVNDRYGVQSIATEFITLNPNFDIGDKAVTTKISSFKWLNNLESRENLYVMPEVVTNEYNYTNYPPTFDSSEATAVLLSPRTVDR
jgi:hypothetical protein